MKKNQIKRYVILDTGAIIDLETYGLPSWGDSYTQYGIKVKDNKVYEEYWSYGGEWEEDIMDETLLGTIVYQSDKPFYIEESSAAMLTTKKPVYVEYGVDLEKIFNLNKNREDENKEK